MSFSSFGLNNNILQAVAQLGYKQPTPVQQQVIPLVLAGQDVIASAQTGTGKTAAFTLPLLQKLSDSGASATAHAVRALILTPTRELAMQVAEQVCAHSHYLPLNSLVAVGGVSIRPQIKQLQRGVDIVVATPGRLLDLLALQMVEFSQLEVLVLDEADRMLDMGFITAIRRIIARLPEQRQNLLFSATFSTEVKVLASRFMQKPVSVTISPEQITAQHIKQQAYLVNKQRKSELLAYLIGTERWQQVLIFTRTRQSSDELAQQLNQDGIKAAAIHGEKRQGTRNRVLREFKEGKLRALVATDIAARGLDIEQLPHVVNYELPEEAEEYIHRIGRTGRAGNRGMAISLVCPEERSLLNNIEKLLIESIPLLLLPEYQTASQREDITLSSPSQRTVKQQKKWLHEGQHRRKGSFSHRNRER